MSAELKELKVRKLAEAEEVDFGPFSSYHPLVADGDTPVRTGIRFANRDTKPRCIGIPYVEVLFIIEGEMDAWQEGEDPSG